MSIILYSVQKDTLYGEIRNTGKQVETIITEYGKTLYHKSFGTLASAKKALNRNIVKF